MRAKSALLAIVFSSALAVSPACAQIPQKPFSEWTQTEQQTLANSLSARSKAECAAYVQQAQTGSMRATYEAAACMYGIFYLGTPADYPGREQFKEQFFENSKNAKALGSNAPFLAGGD